MRAPIKQVYTKKYVLVNICSLVRIKVCVFQGLVLSHDKKCMQFLDLVLFP